MTEFETRPADWLSVREATLRILGHAVPLDEETVPTEESLGRALARGVRARADLPPWDNSAMDGYAVRGEDVAGATAERPVALQVVGEVHAGGSKPPPRVGRREAVRIMTGAPIPPGADTVIRVEHTDAEREAGRVLILSDKDRGRHVRPAGQDMRRGEEVLPAGTTLGSGQIGLLLAAGAREVRVRRPPRVAILSNGDELAALEEFGRVEAGEAIPETNSGTLAAALSRIGCTPVPLGIARDDGESIRTAFREARARSADVLLTSGGASMGERDLLKRILDGLGFQLDFWRVRMRPGTPFSFGILPPDAGEPPLPVFGLPGNPASSFVTFQILVRPYLLRIAGHTRIHRPVLPARAGEPLRGTGTVTHFLRVRLTGPPEGLCATLTGPQTSGLVRAQGLADGLAVVPEGVTEIGEGQPLSVVLLDDFGLGWSEPGYLLQ